MSRRALLALSAHVLLLAGCGGTGSNVPADEGSRSGGTTRADAGHTASASQGLPRGTLILRPLRGAGLTVVDVRTGEMSQRPVPELAPGDALYHLVRTGNRLVFYGGGVTYTLALDLRGPPTSLGESLYFVPSATDGRVWLALSDPNSPETVRDLRAVHEVTLDGLVAVRSAGRPPCRGPTVVAAVEDGVVCQDDGLVVWEPATGKVLRRLAGPYPVDTHENLLAWCGHGCLELHLSDIGSGAETVIRPNGSFSFSETYDGAFSPNGSLLAVPVAVDGREPAARGGSDGIAVVDVRAGRAQLIEGSRSGVYTALAWSRTGDWLFFTTDQGGLMAYRPGAARAISLSAKVPHTVLEMVAG